jgi:hypothetical protein
MQEDKQLVKTDYFLGLDLGQAADFTALTVVERAEFACERDPATWERRKETRLALRHAERMPLGTGYPEIVERVRTVVESRELAGRCQIAVDATGVGRPVVDYLKAARLNCPISAVTITGGQVESSDGDYYSTPKRDLVVRLQVLMQSGGLLIAAGIPDIGVLVREMREMRVKLTESGHEQFGVWRSGEHDDLVLSCALAVWLANKRFPLWGR